MNFKFVSLTQDNFEEAVGVGSKSFPDEADKLKASLTRALDPEKKYLTKCRFFQYFLVIDSDNSKVLALTGLYNKKDYPEDEIWLGWFCVDPECRGQGLGKKTLEWTMNKAKELGYKKLRLYTSDDPVEAAAQKLYKSVGLKIYKQEPSQEYPGETTFYREVIL